MTDTQNTDFSQGASNSTGSTGVFAQKLRETGLLGDWQRMPGKKGRLTPTEKDDKSAHDTGQKALLDLLDFAQRLEHDLGEARSAVDDTRKQNTWLEGERRRLGDLLEENRTRVGDLDTTLYMLPAIMTMVVNICLAAGRELVGLDICPRNAGALLVSYELGTCRIKHEATPVRQSVMLTSLGGGEARFDLAHRSSLTPQELSTIKAYVQSESDLNPGKLPSGDTPNASQQDMLQTIAMLMIAQMVPGMVEFLTEPGILTSALTERSGD